ncbi:hypothetical protein O3M35_003060 [Rhynocoris fuscipes]|uniref:Uncharacterized protein n=1 Tax=Rhynocoris fuscipes TaxID=488301 RepID=A0AAW1CQ82_9HEMI
MLSKPNWNTICIAKHLLIFVILLNHMFQLGSADSTNSDEINKIEQVSNEAQYLKELEDQLQKGDYQQAKLTADLIINDEKIIEVMKKIYEIEKDIDGYLYFAGIVNNLSRRLSIYQYIYNDIILKRDFKPSEENFWIHRLIMVYSSINLWSKIDSSIIQHISESSEIYSIAKNLTESIEKRWLNESIHDRTDNLVFIDNIARSTYYLTNNYHFIRVNVSLYVEFIKKNSIDSWFDINMLLNNRDVITALMTPLNDSEKCNRFLYKHNLYLEHDGKMLVVYLKNKKFDIAKDEFDYMKSNNEPQENAIKEFYMKFKDIDTILTFAELLEENDQIMIYSALYDAIDQTDISNVCDLLKLHKVLANLSHANKIPTIITNLKKSITLAIKKDLINNFPETFITENYFNLVETDYNKITIYPNDNNKIIGNYKYYLGKENSENSTTDACYFNIDISRNNYENWYWKNGIKSSIKFNDFFDFLTKYKRFVAIQ